MMMIIIIYNVINNKIIKQNTARKPISDKDVNNDYNKNGNNQLLKDKRTCGTSHQSIKKSKSY